MPLLLASAGLTAVIGCTTEEAKDRRDVTGNLMAPPLVKLCIEVEPSTAQVLIRKKAVTDGQCIEVSSALVRVEAEAAGYEDYQADVDILNAEGAMTHVITMTPSTLKENSKDATIKKESEKTPPLNQKVENPSEKRIEK